MEDFLSYLFAIMYVAVLVAGACYMAYLGYWPISVLCLLLILNLSVHKRGE